MARQQTNVPLTLLFTLSLNLAWVGGILNPAQAQSSSDAPRLQTGAIAQVTFNPPGNGKPRNTAGGASRNGNSCLPEPQLSSECVTPITPEAVQGLTVASRPTFYVYVPQTSARELFFALKDENNQHHYQTSVPVPEGEGAVMAIALPDDAPPLEIGQTYRWTFILIDETGLKPDSPGVEGDIRRVEANSLTPGSEQADPTLELAQQYGTAGIWYDMMNTLVQIKQSSPNDPTIQASWTGLLASVGLEEIATKPIALP
jgi:hypothetical protein